MTLKMRQAETHDCVKCGVRCHVISDPPPLRVWKCPKCNQVWCPVIYKSAGARDDE